MSAPRASSSVSCCPWSSSPSASPMLRPRRVIVTPSERMRVWSRQETSLGATIAAEGRARALPRAGRAPPDRGRCPAREPHGVALETGGSPAPGRPRTASRARGETPSAPEAATSALVSASRPHRMIVRASTGRVWARRAISVRVRCVDADVRPSGRTTRRAWTRAAWRDQPRRSARARPRPVRGVAGQPARRMSLRRSRSLMPPQMPNRTSLRSAYSRHSESDVARRADLLRVTRRAALLGKKPRDRSVRTGHRSCQAARSSSLVSGRRTPGRRAARVDEPFPRDIRTILRTGHLDSPPCRCPAPYG